MKPYTLGLSYGFHDASAALVHNGHVIAAAAEERFSRQKHDKHFPKEAIRYCLDHAGIDFRDIEKIAYHEQPEQTFSRVLTSALAGFPHTRGEFVAGMKAWLGGKLWTRSEICQRLSVDPGKLTTFHHHHSHAAQAFLGSSFREAAVLTIDAVGEWATTGLFHGEWNHSGPALRPLRTFEFPHSLGLFYSAMTAYLGFRPMDGECSTMALAAFGKPRYLDQLAQILSYNAQTFALDQTYFHFTDFYQKPYSEKLVDLLGPARRHDHPLPFDCLAPYAIDDESQRFADIAASVQELYERVVVSLAKQLAETTGSKNLCIAGGGALNCVANRRVMQETAFGDLYIPIDPGDGGAAAGAALLAYYQNRQAHHQSGLKFMPHIGAQPQGKELNFLDRIKPEHNRRYARLGLQLPKHRLHATHAKSDAELVDAIATDIADGKIVGWCQGRFEHGPRALGSRSILIRPDDKVLAQRLSRDVKSRASYRPYALSMTAEAAAVLITDTDTQMTPFHWMQMTWPISPDQRHRVAAGLHIDGTTRPQVVSDDENPRYAKLLRAVGDNTGLGVVLNTSFNESGYPLVNTAVEALAVFARTAMDVLVVDRLIIRKEWL